MDDRNAARQIAAIFGCSCREPGNDPGLDPALDSAAEVVARIRAEARAKALSEAVSRALAWKWPEDGTGRHDLFNRGIEGACSAILAYEPTHGDKDYPEDALYENGNYECICFTCGSHFIGHKGRVLCKACDAILSDEPKEREAKHDNEDSFHITQAQAAEWHTQLVEEEEENKRLQAQHDELLEVVKYTRQVLPQDIWANDLKVMLDTAISNAEKYGA